MGHLEGRPRASQGPYDVDPVLHVNGQTALYSGHALPAGQFATSRTTSIATNKKPGLLSVIKCRRVDNTKRSTK